MDYSITCSEPELELEGDCWTFTITIADVSSRDTSVLIADGIRRMIIDHSEAYNLGEILKFKDFPL